MGKVKVAMEIEIADVAVEELKSSFIHHVEEIIDLKAWPEIESVIVKKIEE